ncbi:MAG: hypothetical protein MAG431_01015 [Chloroflexi bacterium]|nr:hypothetical protein [Chloroflexota bacterium]
MTKKTNTDLPPHHRWNFVAFMTDAVCFGIAFAFFDPSNVLPAFVRQFTHSSLVVGLVGTVFNGFWLLPQLVTGRLITGKSRKKPYMVGGMWGRALFFGLGLALWAGLGNYPALMLIFFFLVIGLFALSDSITAVAWFDILAKAIPMKQRGRLLGTAQLISGVAGLGVGAIIASILGNPHIAFPNNYALIFTLAGLVFIPSVVALGSIREPILPEPDKTEAIQSKNNGWLAPFREDARFRRWTVARIFVGMISLSTPFYVGHALDKLSLPLSVVGGFVAAQTLAKALGGVVFGVVSDRWGPRFVIWAGGILAAIGPLFAVVVQLVDGGGLAWAYPLVYVMLGFVQASWMLGFFNYLLEIAPIDRRPLYIGLSNTVMGVITLAPILGGWLLESTSYPVLFGTTVAFVIVGVLLTLTLDNSGEARTIHLRS